MKLLVCFLIVLFFANAHALVDVQGGNFTETTLDLRLPDSGYSLSVERAYNSRTLYNGIFGFGMCSNLETKLEKLADFRVKRIECGSGQEIDYIPRTYTEANAEEGIKKIMAEYKKRNPKANARALQLTEKKLKEDSLYRDELNIQYGINTAVREGTIFYAVGNPSDKIVLTKTHYQRDLEDGSSERFDLQGRLSLMYDKNKNFVRFDYDKDKLTSITSSSGNRLSISYYQTGKVKEIRGPRNISALYKYDKLNDLVYVKTGANEEYEYKYDNLHNMTQITYPDKTTKKLSYNQDRDWVVGLVDRNGCTESYDYQLSKQDPKNNFFANVEKKCEGKVVNKSRYGFWFKERSNKSGSFLSKLTMDVNGVKSEVEYHDAFEKPVRIKRPNEIVQYDYFPNGLLKSKKTNNTLITYKYNKENRVEELREGKKFTKFKYNSRGNLTFAENSAGQKVQFDYNDKGQIIRIEDQAKRVMKIDHDEKIGKISRIARPGIGSITISYDANGVAQRVRSSDSNDPTTAVQVVAAFNDIMEIVMPAGIQAGI